MFQKSGKENSNRKSLKRGLSSRRGVEAQIISMYVIGMTVRDIFSHVQALYGIELSPTSVSNITDKIMEEWYSRTLGFLSGHIPGGCSL